MTIKHQKTFDAMQPAGFDGQFDWDFLLPIFQNHSDTTARKITPMDLDAVIERYGNFLVFETKTEGKDIPLGQKILLENLIKLGKSKITLFVLYGKTPETIIGMEEWKYSFGQVVKDHIQCDYTFVAVMVEEWFNRANQK